MDDTASMIESNRAGRLRARLAALSAGRRWLLVTLAAVLLGAGLRMGQYLARWSYWHDEAALVLNVFEKPARELLGPLDSAQAAPPLFLLLQRGVYLTLGRSELAMRLVPLALGLASLALFAALAWRVLPPDGAALAVIMFCLSDRLIWHATEAKQYAGDAFAALLLLLCVVPPRGVTRRATSQLIRAALIASVAVWFSHPVAFVFGGISLALLPAVWRERRVGAYVACNALFAISFLALYVLSIRKQQVRQLYEYWADRFADFSQPSQLPGWLLAQTTQLFNYPYEMAGAVLLVIAVLGAWEWVSKGRLQLLAAILVPAALVLVAACLRRYPFGGNRLTLFLAPGLLLLAAQGILEVRRHLLPRIGHWWIALPAFLIGVGIYHATFRPPARAHIRPAVRYVQQHRQPGDAIYTTKDKEFLCYWRPADPPLRSADEIDGPSDERRFWVVASYTEGRFDRVMGERIARIEAFAVRRDAHFVPGGVALLFERIEPSTRPGTTAR